MIRASQYGALTDDPNERPRDAQTDISVYEWWAPVIRGDSYRAESET